MAETQAQLTPEQNAALQRLSDCFTQSIAETVNEAADTMKLVAEVLNQDRVQRATELRQRLDLARAEQDAATYTEFTARQSAFLAQASRRAEEQYGVSLSPFDLLCGILNGVQAAGLDLGVCGSREDVQDLIEHLLNAGTDATR